jgi:hypothetical protein
MKKLRIIILILIVSGILILKYGFRNSDSLLGHISNTVFNNNGFELNCTGLDKSEVNVIWSGEQHTKTILVSSGKQINDVPYEYGPNRFDVRLPNGVAFQVGHFKTRNWDPHDYTIDLKKDLSGYKITFIADGGDFEHSEQQFDLNGKLNGLSCSYYKNGNLSTRRTYIHGLQEGQSKFYFENGTIRVTDDFLHGKLNGYDIRYTPDGKVEYKTKYVNGEEVKE